MLANEYRRNANRCHPRGRPATSDGVHLVARHYRKGVRLDTHMHREAQLVYAAKGPCRSPRRGALGWCRPTAGLGARPSRTFDRVLADIEMRTLYFDLAWLARESAREPRCGIRGAGARLLHEAILALFDAAMTLTAPASVKLAVLELHRAEDSATFIPLPHEPRCRRAATSCSTTPNRARMRSRRWRARSGPRRGRCRGCFHRRRH